MKMMLICFAVALAAALTGMVPAAPRVVVEERLRGEERALSAQLDNVQEFSRFVRDVIAELREGKLDSQEANRRVLARAYRQCPRYLELLQRSEGADDLPPEELVARMLARRVRDAS